MSIVAIVQQSRTQKPKKLLLIQELYEPMAKNNYPSEFNETNTNSYNKCFLACLAPNRTTLVITNDFPSIEG
jgi:hypothetical protein